MSTPDTGATTTQLLEANISTAHSLGVRETRLGDGRLINTESYLVEIELDGLTSVQLVLVGDPLLGIDIYKRYSSVWNWDNPIVPLP